MNYVWVVIEKLGVVFVNILSIALLARILSPDDFGLYAMVAFIIALATMLIDSGMSGSLIKKKDAKDLDFSTIFLFNFFISALLYIIIFFSAPVLADIYGREELELLIRILAVSILIKGFSFIQITKMTKNLAFKKQSFIFILSKVGSTLVAYLMAKVGFGYWALVGQQVADSTFSTVMLYVSGNYMPKMRFSKYLFKEHFGFGSRLLASSLIEVIYKNVVVTFAGKNFGATSAGYYFQASKINDIFIQLATSVVDKAAFPVLASQADNRKRFFLSIISTGRLVYFICFFVISILVACSDEVILLLLGRQWKNSVWILEIVAASGFGMIIDSMVRCYLKSLGMSLVILRMTFAKRFFSIITLFVLSFFGLNEMLWGYFILSVFSAFVSIYCCKIFIGYSLKNQAMDILPFVALSISSQISINYFSKIMSFPAIWSLCILTAIGLFTYLFLALAFRVREVVLIKNIIIYYRK